MRACALLLAASLSGAAAATDYGPGGFVLPVPDNGRDMLPGGERDPRFWSYFDLGPEVCAGWAPAVHATLDGTRGPVRLAVPCPDFIHALVPEGPHPKGWGRAEDPIVTTMVSAVLAREPDVLLTVAVRGPDVLKLDERVRASLASGRCTDLGEGFLRCPQTDWKPAHILYISARAADRWPDGTALAVECDMAGGIAWCALRSGRARDRTGFTIHAGFASLSPEDLDRFRVWRGQAEALIAEWRAP